MINQPSKQKQKPRKKKEIKGLFPLNTYKAFKKVTGDNSLH